MDSSHLNNALKVLFVGDPNLGRRGAARVQARFADVSTITWDIHSPQAEREAAAIRGRILENEWDLGISFYNDLIFGSDELARMKVPLNIHPATPELPGVGHDTLPLIENHKRVGATLHIMTPRVDAGPILDVLERDLPSTSTHSSLRLLTQELCLELLDRTCTSLHSLDSRKALIGWIESRHAEVPRSWGKNYISRRRLRDLLAEFEVRRPGHPVFR